MTVVRAKPMRSVGRELVSLALMASVPVAIALVFPYEAMNFRAERGVEPRAACAFVTLGEEEERAALASARTAWQVDSRSVRHLRVDLTSGDDLPPAPVRPVIAARPPRGACAASGAAYVPNALPPTVAAPAPAVIAPDAAPPAAKPAFSREELLKIP